MSKAKSLADKFGGNLAQTIAMRPGLAPPMMAEQGGADKYDGAIKSRAFAELPLDAIVRDETQPREEFDPTELRWLADSIARFGQISPIRVRHDAARGKWVVLVGERRLRACKLAGLDKVRVEFVERDMTEADILAEQTIENMVRATLTPVEQGKAYRRLMDLNGWTVLELAATIGVDATAAHRSLGLLRLPEDIAEKVDAGEIRATAAYEIAKLPDAETQREVAEAVVAGDLGLKETVAVVRQAREAGEARKAKAAPSQKSAGRSAPAAAKSARAKVVPIRVYKTAVGIKLTAERSKGVEIPVLIDALSEVIERLRLEMGAGQGSEADAA
ncbi:ParB/RepB/Spo0J family partition protein (plasmid) [Tundrisphaera sp. TA3]|uniref:ParB/RepB/Spo0J family partition protein n=1 Tax=Tundrisphaera sp. TA3 TaxID=3435775 RepID=UPI003EBB440E